MSLHSTENESSNSFEQDVLKPEDLETKENGVYIVRMRSPIELEEPPDGNLYLIELVTLDKDAPEITNKANDPYDQSAFKTGDRIMRFVKLDRMETFPGMMFDTSKLDLTVYMENELREKAYPLRIENAIDYNVN